MKKKKRKSIKQWFNELPAKLSKRYIGDFHPRFLQLMQRSKFVDKNVYQDIAYKRAEKLMKLLSSPKYKKYFYAAVAYDPHMQDKEILVVPKTWWGRLFDKIAYHISKAYVYVFAREVYENIKSFEIVSKGIVELNTKIDNYIANTTIEERLERAGAYGIVSVDNMNAQKRLRKHQSSRVAKILAHNVE